MLRPTSANDVAFLRALFAAVRGGLFDGLPAAQGAALVDMQWRAQAAGHTATFPHAVDHVIEVHGEPVGRALVDRATDRITVVDLAVHPTQQGRGIASAVLAHLVEEAAGSDRVVTLTVDRDNLRAIALYRRLGFVEDGSGTATDLPMRRDPSA